MSEKFKPVSGGCLCGAVRYEAEVNLREAYYCHCQTCQKLTGSPATVGVLVKPGTLSYAKEEPKFYQSARWYLLNKCTPFYPKVIDIHQ